MRSLTYLSNIKFPFSAKEFVREKGLCAACGEKNAKFTYYEVVNDRLATEWSIDKNLQEAFSRRESMHCSSCRCSARSRAHAKAILLARDVEYQSLSEAIKGGAFNDLKVAEINSCGDLHNILKSIKGLAYSEYGPRAINIRDEDLQSLTYPEGSFDIVLTSDTLEHVPDYNKALAEIHRVLKPGGQHIFTLPVIFSRKTRRRIKIQNDSIVPVMDGSYHGAGEADNLVCTEFGVDVLSDFEKADFSTKIYFSNPLFKNEVNCVLVSTKSKG